MNQDTRKNAAVIIGIHPMIGLYIDELCDWCSVNYKKVYIVEFYNHVLFSNGLKKSNIELVSYLYKNYIGYLFYLMRARSRIDAIIENHEMVEILIPHPMHLLTNYAARKANLSHSTSLSIIPDGILGYRDCNTESLATKITQKRLLSTVCGLGHYRIKDRCLGHDVFQYKRIFALTEKGLIIPDGTECIILKRKVGDYNTGSNKCLIIGQPVDSCQPDLYEKILQRFKSWLQDHKINEVFYKPHQSQKLNHKLSEILRIHGVMVDHRTVQVEFLMTEYTYFLSTTSSALANIKIINKQATCCAFLDKQWLRKCGTLGNLNSDDDILINSLKVYFVSVGVAVYEFQ